MLLRANFLGVSVMTIGSRYRINEKQVVYQSFDEEIIAINLDLGTYYSLRGAGAELWSWIAKGYDLAAIRQAIGETYLGDPVVIAGECFAFVDKLAESGLVTSETDGAQGSVAPAGNGRPKIAFVAPELEVFTDMQDLLLLDPIHDGDQSGWPHGKADR